MTEWQIAHSPHKGENIARAKISLAPDRLVPVEQGDTSMATEKADVVIVGIGAAGAVLAALPRPA